MSLCKQSSILLAFVSVWAVSLLLFASGAAQQSPAKTAPARAADCNVEGKSTDSFKDVSGKLKCLEDRIRTLEALLSPSPGASASAPPPAPGLTVGGMQENGGVRFELESCKKLGSSIVCRVFITSLGKDKQVDLVSNSRTVDANGVLYRWRGYQGLGEKGIETRSSSRRFVSDVRTSASLFFDAETDQAAQSLAVVQIEFRADDLVRQVSFRNIALR